MSSKPDPPPPPGTGLAHRTFAGFFWSLSGTGGQALLQVLVLAVLARLLTPADFGLVAVAIIVVNFTTTFSELGVGPAIVQRPRLEPRHERVGFTLTLLFGLVAFGAVQLAAPAISGLFRMEALTPVLRLVAVVFLLRSVAVIAEKLLQRELRFRVIAAVQVGSYAVGFGVVGVLLALLGFGVWALAFAYLVQATVAAALLLLVRPHPKRPSLERAAALELLTFGGGFTLARVFNQIALEGDNFVVGRWLGAAALGLYGRAYQLMTMPASLFGAALDKVLFPAMARLQHRRDLLATVYRRGVALIALLTLPASAVLFLVAPEFIAVLLGPGWEAVVPPFRVLVLGMLFRTSYKMSDSLARATGAVYRRAWRQGVYAAAVVAGAWIGRGWGLTGVTVGVLVALSINFTLMAQLSLTLTDLRARDLVAVHLRALLPTVVLALAGGAAAALLRDAGAAPLLVLVGTGASALGAGLALLWAAPATTLGEDGLWTVRRLGAYLPARFRTLTARPAWLRGSR